MPKHIAGPSRIEAAGSPPKIINEFIGRVNSHDSALSIARMKSPKGWLEPGQRPEFDEFTVVLAGTLRGEHAYALDSHDRLLDDVTDQVRRCF